MGDARRLRKQGLRIQSEFVGIELDLAQTFCEAAFGAGHAEKAQRNFEYARRAWESANKFVERIRLHEGIQPNSGGDRFQDVGNALARLTRQLHADFV